MLLLLLPHHTTTHTHIQTQTQKDTARCSLLPGLEMHRVVRALEKRCHPAHSSRSGATTKQNASSVTSSTNKVSMVRACVRVSASNYTIQTSERVLTGLGRSKRWNQSGWYIKRSFLTGAENGLVWLGWVDGLKIPCAIRQNMCVPSNVSRTRCELTRTKRW